jgi:hypothetical protein
MDELQLRCGTGLPQYGRPRANNPGGGHGCV